MSINTQQEKQENAFNDPLIEQLAGHHTDTYSEFLNSADVDEDLNQRLKEMRNAAHAHIENMSARSDAEQNYSENETLSRKALFMAKRDYGQNSSESANHMIILANILIQHKNIDAEAELLFMNALSINTNKHGTDHIDTVPAVNALAYYYLGCARFGESQSLFQRALIISEKKHGTVHLGITTALNNLACSFHLADKHEAAQRLYQRVLAIHIKTHRKENLAMAQATLDLALMHHTQERHAVADILFRRALAISERTCGIQHQHTGIYIFNLAEFLFDCYQYAEAESLYKRALMIH